MRNLPFVMLLALFSCGKAKDLPVVDQVDLEKYQGRWYEIASLPQRPQRHCKCTYAEYTIEGDKVKVYNRCIDKRDDSVIDINGKAVAEEGSNNAKLKVSFFIGLVKAPYYIIELDENYQYAMVGTPDRHHLWILCRETSMEEELYNSLLNKAQDLGFPIEKLNITKQDC